ncbi:MAG: UPF0149 family protein [Azoarcus sp.]|jgi:uncharacterized protein|nr:UPF0149 family protein [Azoarcus sp.]
MTTAASPPLLLSEEDSEALEEILVSGAVPEGCMDLEMLDGFLAGVLISPRPVTSEHWLPPVWSAYGDEDFGAGGEVRDAIRLVLAYYNELATTIGREDEDRWEPFCFAAEEGDDALEVGDGWFDGFTEGLDLWPEDWRKDLPGDLVDFVQDTLRAVVAPWEVDEIEASDMETRIGWLAAAGKVVNDIFRRWRNIGLPAPAPIAEQPAPPKARPGRNEPCPCGSGRKYKKCCETG